VVYALGAAGMVALLAAVRLKDVLQLKSSLSDKYVAFFDHPALLLVGFAGVSALIYFITYIPEMILGDSILDVFNLQYAMLGSTRVECQMTLLRLGGLGH